MDPVVHLRNHTLGAVHERTCFLYSRVVPRYLRVPIECALLMSVSPLCPLCVELIVVLCVVHRA